MFAKRFYQTRLPRSSVVRLTSRRLFILPSAAGNAGLFAMLAVYLLATNYQNNLILLFAYLLLSLFLITLLASFYNLHGVALQLLSAKPVFLGEYVKMQLNIQSERERFAICWEDDLGTHQTEIKPGQNLVNLYWLPENRGYFKLPRFKMFSRAPLGLFTVWSYPALGESVLIYPALPKTEVSFKSWQSADHEQSSLQNDVFSALNNYQKGDPVSRVLWKKALPERPWQVKEFSQEKPQPMRFNYQAVAGKHETRLSQLAALVVMAQKTELPFALILPDQTITSGIGETQGQLCLQALALQPEVNDEN
ncbi:DUF58 domain-containing protein [Gayadomonas joobiniege]|uniref:DUF58 domain-containing protein n=1 Tax=Gayadomonas joobiniege TaxID=1234606 RepID=UPI00035CB0DC|nr:DUF58 domain-containing protein [Gayadomonas joobiniege]